MAAVMCRTAHHSHLPTTTSYMPEFKAD